MSEQVRKYPDGFLENLLQHIHDRTEAENMTDGELALALTNEVWTQIRLSTRPSALIDEAITRLKRADIRRRWQERKERRSA